MDELTFKKCVADGYNYIPVFKSIVVDVDTALGLYLKLANNTYSYLFESVQGGEKWGRYSIIGLSAHTVIKVFDWTIHIEKAGKLVASFVVKDPLVWIESFQKKYKVPKLAEMPNFNGGFVGYFGYEIIRYIEPKLASINKIDELQVADILLMVSSDLVVVDNLLNKAFLITHINPEKQTYQDALAILDNILTNVNKQILVSNYKLDNIKSPDLIFNFDDERFKKIVKKIQKYIIAGDVMQVVPSQRSSCKFSAPPIELYRRLRLLNPSPYMYFLNLDDFFIIGSSPEILVRVDDDKTATLRPIAGTRYRGKNKIEDLALEKELLADEKEIAEHLMLIDLGRNDLGRIAQTGSVKLTVKMIVERYSHVMHIVSNIECKLKQNISVIDVLKATFPAGTLSGSPKVRAMEIINEVETLKRSVYSGAVGYLSWHGSMDMAIAIRTAVIKNKKLYVQAGGGIVHDSVPQLEWNETMYKVQALIKAAQQV